SLQRLAEAEIVAVQRQHLVAENRVEHPIREIDSDFRHSAGFSVPEDVPTVDQAEARGLVLSASLDVGPDGGAFVPVEGGEQLLIGTPVVVSVRGHQQVICLDVKRPVRLVPGVHLGNKLANAIDKYILVMDRSQAK